MFKFLKTFLKEVKDPRIRLQERFSHFRRLLDSNNQALSLMADLEEKSVPEILGDGSYLFSQIDQLGEEVSCMVSELDQLSPDRYPELLPVFQRIREELQHELERVPEIPETPYILPLHALTREKSAAVGAKMANLGEIRNRLGLTVPRGFAVTGAAYQAFMAGTGLAEAIARKLADVDTDNLESLEALSQEIQDLVLATPLPRDLEEILLLAAQALPTERLAVRSSAVGEDTDYSFAGQFATLLNVTIQDLPLKYKKIIASKFTSRAMRYWCRQNLAISELPMAVGVLSMIPARVSGVMFTLDPHEPQANTLMINALWGLGKYAVEGTVNPDLYVVEKHGAYRLRQQQISHKPVALNILSEGGYQEQTLPPEQAEAACLSTEQIRSLVAIGLALEKHFGGPQDVEWTVDQEGAIVLLQSRPLRVESTPVPEMGSTTGEAIPVPEILPVLVGGRRAVAGVAAGPIHILRHDRDIEKIPEGAVVVSRQPSTRLVLVMDRIKAIITEVGSPTDHMTILAREFRVPTVVGASKATEMLHQGQMVTVDADHARVYPGILVELLNRRQDNPDLWRENPKVKKFRQVLNKVVPLRLIDPENPDFQARNCRTLHDITRFCHEKAMDAMFSIAVEEAVSAPGVSRLQSDLPFNLFVLDLGGGLAAHEKKVIEEKDILSRPLKAMLRGFHHPEVRSSGQVTPDLKGFISVFANTMYDAGKTEGGLGGKSFAIVSDSYVNFSSRLGYHFGLVDALVTPEANDNYISFQFKGGAASLDRRERRIHMLQALLEDIGFKVETQQDLVQGRLVKFPLEEIESVLESLAILMAFCRQLDMAFSSAAVMHNYLEAFRKKDYGLSSLRAMQ